MLRCLAGICGDVADDANATIAPPPEPGQRVLVKPIVRLDEAEEGAEAATFQDLAALLGLVAGPPGAPETIAWVSKDYEKNAQRLLILFPSSSSIPGAGKIQWDASLPCGLGAVPPLLRWAKANLYALALFSPQKLQAAPFKAWDAIVRGSPARYVSVLVAAGALPVLTTALGEVHPLLLSRFRNIVVSRHDSASSTAAMLSSSPLSSEHRDHFGAATVVLPAAWEQMSCSAGHEHLFQLLIMREERWQKTEMKKYTGFQNLKENDVPGIRRIGVEARINRLDRNRHDDELARLLQKHEKEAAKTHDGDSDGEDEPGID